MTKPRTRSSGIRMPAELYDRIDRRAEKKRITRSQCVCELVRLAGRSLTTKPNVKAQTNDVVWAGALLSAVVVTLSLEGFIRLIANP